MGTQIDQANGIRLMTRRQRRAHYRCHLSQEREGTSWNRYWVDGGTGFVGGVGGNDGREASGKNTDKRVSADLNETSILGIASWGKACLTFVLERGFGGALEESVGLRQMEGNGIRFGMNWTTRSRWSCPLGCGVGGLAKVDQKQLRRLLHRFVVDALGGEPELEANVHGVRLGKTNSGEREKLTSNSRRRAAAFSHRIISRSLVYLSMSILVFSSRIRAASSAPLNDASCVWAESGGGVFVPEAGGHLGVGARLGVLPLPFSYALPFPWIPSPLAVGVILFTI